MAIRGKRILVTGGAGFIGSWIAEELCSGNEVTILDDFSTGKMNNLEHIRDRIAIVKGDVRDAPAVGKCVKGAEIVFHQAANVQIQTSLRDPVMDAEINAIGTLNVLEAARKHGTGKVVIASSSSVYGEPARLPLREDDPKRPANPYAVSKLAAENYATLYASVYGMGVAALRYFNVYGPRQDPGSPYSGVISIFSNNLRQGKCLTVFGDGEQTRDFVSVRDVVRANVLAAESGKATGKAINIGTGKSISLNGMIKVMERLSGRKLEVIHSDARKGDVKHSRADMRLASDVLGFEAGTSLEEGLGELLGKG